MATTTEDETTVELKTENGSSGPIPLDEFNERADEAIERLRSKQLSFDVGGKEPSLASVKATVDLRIPRELRKGSQVRVAVTTVDGEVLAQTLGKIVAVTFEDKYDNDGFLVATERIHKVKL